MLLEKLRADYKQALKEKNTINKGVLSLVISAVNLKAKEENKELTNEEIYPVIQRELKQTREALDLTPQNRVDLIEENNKKIDLLMSYLPKQLTIEELKESILALNIELIKKNQGIIIKNIMAKHGSSTDGKTINIVLKDLLQ